MDQQEDMMADEILGNDPVGAAVAMAQELTPQEIEERERAAREEILARLEAFGLSMAKKRDDAITARAASGIEQEWVEDEEAYAGIDEVNRGDTPLKPRTLDGSLTSGNRAPAGRSTVFLNITRPYVDAAAARVADMLLPTDDRNFAIRPTPIPELVKFKNDVTPVADPMSGQPMMGPQGQPVTVKDQVKAIYDEAKRRADLAQDQIDDWLVQCYYNAEVRKVIEDASRLGTGILKGPFPRKNRKKSFSMQGNIAQLMMEERIDPASKRIDPWNFYPAADCGEDVESCSGTWEKDTVSAKQLRDLTGLPGYLPEQIQSVLEEGPGKKNQRDGKLSFAKVTPKDDDTFEIWYFHGTADRDNLLAAGLDVPEGTTANVLLTMVNDRIIRAALSPLESGEYPYDIFVWQRRAGYWAGVGVSRQVRTPQRMINAASRNMMDNAGLSSGPQIIMDREAVVPANGVYEITPRKLWYANDIEGKGVNSAFLAVNIPTLQAELMAIIQYASKMAEDVTGLPQIMQGQQGAAPETVGGMTMLNNNANTVLRRIARQFDDQITKRHIRRYYEWLLLYGENEEAKGDFKIDARGSSALIERDIQTQALVQVGQLIQNPAFGINPQKWFVEMCKSQKLDAMKFTYTPEEMQQIQEQMAQNQRPDPRVEVAQIKAQADAQIAQVKEQTKQVEIQKDVDRDAVYVQAEADRTRAEFEGRMRELDVKRELAMLQYANNNQVTLEQIKADLAKESMRLRTQKELAAASNQAKQVARPATEPPGRAPKGQAFQR